MKSSDDEFLGKLQAAFRVEAEEHLQAITAGLLALEKTSEAPRRQEIVSSIFRDAHSLKGAARAVNLAEIEMVCQALEGVFSAWKRRDAGAAPELLDPLHRAVKVVERLLPTSRGAASEVERDELFKVQEELAALEVARPAPRRTERAAAPVETKPQDDPVRASDRAMSQEPTAPSPGTPGEGRGEGDSEVRATVANPKSPSPYPSPGIPGEGTRGVSQETGFTARQAPAAAAAPAVAPAAAASSAPETAASPAPEAAPSPRDRGAVPRSSLSQTLRISTDKLDALLLHAEELLALKLNADQRASDLRDVTVMWAGWEKQWTSLTADIQSLRQMTAAGADGRSVAENDSRDCVVPASLAARLLEFFDWNQSFVRSAEDQLRTVAKLADRDRRDTAARVDLLLEESKRLLMLPFSTLFAAFPRLVRELSRDMGKEIELVIRGEDSEIDKRILEDLKDPLIHLLRNCIDHGIETPQQRTAAGKPGAGPSTLPSPRRTETKLKY